MAFMRRIFGVYGEKVLGVLIGNVLCVIIEEYIGSVIVKQCWLTYYGPILVEVLWTKYGLCCHGKYGCICYGEYVFVCLQRIFQTKAIRSY